MKIKKYFSLVELLLVMFIASLMLGIVIPTFHKLTKGISVEMAARQLGGQLKAVREYAITNREYVALIIEPINSTSSPPTNNLPVGYNGIAYRPCIVTSSGSSTWDAGGTVADDSDWVYGERWEFLPEGSQLENIQGISQTITGLTDSSLIGYVNDNAFPIIVFTPTGKCEGVSGSGATLTVSDVTGLDTSDKKNKVNITIAGYTGRVSYGDN